DNASNNDAMIRELEDMVPSFSSSASHTRCFLHVVNLVAKSLIRQFDVTKDANGVLNGGAGDMVDKDLIGQQ
ncbi:hypothetical protein PAXRUDRAFT_169130, partial [Paxillus rubicundulus Ve08.2h10]